MIEVAIDLFSKNGFERTTTKAIAEAAGVSEGNVFRYFKTKDELYTAILDEKANQSGFEDWESDLRKCAARKDDEGLIRLVISKILESYRRDPQFQRLLFQAALDRHPIHKLMNERRSLPIFHFLCEYVGQRQKEGAFRGRDPGVAVFALVGMPAYFAIAKSLLGVNLLQQSESALASTFADILLNGLRDQSTSSSKGGRA